MSLSDQDKIECPYERSHQILPERFQKHLVKCRRSHSDVPKVVCPYNATHVIGECEYKYHKENCPDVKVILCDLIEEQDNTQVDPIIMPIPDLAIESSENWDDVNVPSYNPEEHTSSQPVIRSLRGSTPSARKQFRLQERKRIQQVQSLNESEEVRNIQTLRKPNSRANNYFH